MEQVPDPLVSQAPLIVYIDIKSPYAFLATFPAMDIEDKLGVQFDWRPLTLDIPSYLGSAKLAADGKVAEQSRSEEQWRAVKYAYADCRRYASLRGLTLRGTVKIWDTSTVHIAMMWARRQGHEIQRRFIQEVYEPFWRRQLDAEDSRAVAKLLGAAGAELRGFDEFLAGEGRAEHDVMQREIFDAGIFGVPSFVLNGEVFFGREHLPRIFWELTGAEGSPPDVAYQSFSADSLSNVSTAAETRPHEPARALEMAIDFTQPESYLALAPAIQLANELDLELKFRPFAARPHLSPEGGERTERHLGYRREHHQRQLAHAAAAQGLRIDSRPRGAEAAHCGLLWTEQVAPSKTQPYVEAVFEAGWQKGRDLSDVKLVNAILERAGAPALDFVQKRAAKELSRVRSALEEAGVVDAPGFLFAGEYFMGRAHLPLIRWRALHEAGPPPL